MAIQLGLAFEYSIYFLRQYLPRLRFKRTLAGFLLIDKVVVAERCELDLSEKAEWLPECCGISCVRFRCYVDTRRFHDRQHFSSSIHAAIS